MENELNLNELMNDLNITSTEVTNNDYISVPEEATIDLNTLSSMPNVDISTVVAPEKLGVLSSLGVMTSSEFNLNTEEKEISENVDKLDEQVEEKVEEITIDTNIDEPNIILPKAEIVRALRYAQVMIKKVTNDIEASSLNITYKDDGKVEYKLKDNMTWVKLNGTCEVSNNKPLMKTLSFNISYLTKLLLASAGKVLIYEGDSTDAKGEEKRVLYARLINGDFILDVREGDENKLTPAGNKTTLIKSIPANTVSTLCDVMLPLIADTQEVQSKRAILYNDRAFFRSVTYLLQFRNEFSNMCLSKKELDLLKLVSAGTNDNIDIYNTDSNGENRIVIEGSNVSISTSVSIPARDEMIISRFREIEDAKYMSIDANDFKRVLFLSGLGSNTVARVTMNYNVDNQGIDAKIIGKDGNSSFLVKGDNYNFLEPRSEDVTIYTVQLSALLKSFEGGKSLEVAFLNSGVAFRDKSLGIEAIMNYARN